MKWFGISNRDFAEGAMESCKRVHQKAEVSIAEHLGLAGCEKWSFSHSLSEIHQKNTHNILINIS